MRASLLVSLALAALLGLLAAEVVAARHSYLHAHWHAAHRSVHPTTLHRVNLALKQRNVDQLKQFVDRASDPRHDKYAQWMTLEEVADLVSPSQQDLDALELVLLEAGAVSVDITASRDFASVLLPISAVHALFPAADGSGKLDMRVHTHAHSGRKLLRAKHGQAHAIREDLAPYVDIVTGLTDFFDFPLERKAAKRAASKATRATAFAAAASAREAGKDASLPPHLQSCVSNAPDFGRLKSSHEDASISLILYCQSGNATADPRAPCSDFPPAIETVQVRLIPRAHNEQDYTFNVKDLDCELSASGEVHCVVPTLDFPAWGRMRIDASVTYADGSVSKQATYGSGFAPSPFLTPNMIFERYSVPRSTKGVVPANSQAVVAFEEQYIDVKGDLRNFYRDLGIVYKTPTIDGQNDPSQPGGESTLDIQYITAIGQNIPTTFMSLTGSGPAKPPGDGAYILEWAMHISNMSSAPLVTSVSYGDSEQGYYQKFGSFSYIDRMEVELAKMAARGLSVLAGSGDAGTSNVGEAGNDISDTYPTCSPFSPFYPSNSAYVTSVSSTFLSTNYLPVCQSNLPVSSFRSLPLICEQLGEIAVGVSQGMFWTTGGGFSNRSDVNPIASWQADAVNNYLQTAILPPTDMWNPAGRGYPDVATLGHNLLMHFSGNISTVDGTSASGPVMAGLVSLINDYRLRNNQPSMGLLNPFLYQAAAAETESFMDVTVGHNFDGDIQPKCSAYPTTCPYGFRTQPGWNPVTGLGTPNWSVLKAYALSVGSPDAKRTRFD